MTMNDDDYDYDHLGPSMTHVYMENLTVGVREDALLRAPGAIRMPGPLPSTSRDSKRGARAAFWRQGIQLTQNSIKIVSKGLKRYNIY